MSQLLGDLNFGLDDVSDGVALVDAQGSLHDQVQYASAAPWPEEPNGRGYTLELMHPDLDNSLAESWKASKALSGTPGRKNSQSIVSYKSKLTNQAYLEFKVYPSPFQYYSDILFSLEKADQISVSL